MEACRNIMELASSEIFSEQILQDLLLDVHETMISPTLQFWGYQMATVILGFTAGYSVFFYHISMYNSCSFSLLVSLLWGAKIAGYLVFAMISMVTLLSPIHTCLCDFYDMIRDELYLVGKRLENNAHGAN